MKLTRFTITLGVAMAVAGCGKKENPEVAKAKVLIKQAGMEFEQKVKKKVAELLGPLGAPSKIPKVQTQMDLCVATVSEIVDFGVDKAAVALDGLGAAKTEQELIQELTKQLEIVVKNSLSQIKSMIAKLLDHLQELVQRLVPVLVQARLDPQFASVMPEVKSKEDVQAVADLVKLGLKFVRQIIADDYQKQPLTEFEGRVPLHRLTLGQDIEVLSDFMSDTEPPVHIAKHKRGKVKKVGDKNDVEILFEDSSKQRVLQSNFRHIGVMQDIPSLWEPAVGEMRKAMEALGESIVGYAKSAESANPFPETQALWDEIKKLFWFWALNQELPEPTPSNVSLDVESVFLMLMIGVLAVVSSFRGRFVLFKDRFAEETCEFEAGKLIGS